MENLIYTISVFSGYFVACTLFTALLNSIMLKFSVNLGVRNLKEQLRWSNATKPSIGGFSFYVIFLVSLATYPLFFEESTTFNKQLLGLLACTGLAFLMGLSDDAYNTRPVLKFIIQLVCGLILINSGIYIEISNHFFINYLITLLWVVGMMNSINMLDNMDGITALVSIVSCFCFLVLNYSMTEVLGLDAYIIVGIIAALTGFLFYNFPPAKMFMGDTGSQYLGLMLGYFGIKYVWNFNMASYDDQSFSWLIPISMVLLTFIVPIIDTTTVTINRMAQGKSPFVGGKDHTTHGLFYSGLNEKKVNLLMLVISVSGMLLILLSLNWFETWAGYFAIFCVIYFVVVLSVIYYITIKQVEKKSKTDAVNGH